MRSENAQTIFSATDLTNFLGCKYVTELDRAVVEGRLDKQFRTDPMLELLAELGEQHEQAFVRSLRAQGKSVYEFEKFSDPTGSLTLKAIQEGWDVITQATLQNLPWRGFADLLIKVDRPSSLGNYSYEVADTKLASITKASAVIQLCLYTDLLEKIQGVRPEFMYVIKPKRRQSSEPFIVDRLRVDDYMAYYRMAKNSFTNHLSCTTNETLRPEPCEHCQVCNWWPRCNEQWRTEDHLTYIAGITKSQRIELIEQGTETLTDFADSKKPLTSHPKRGAIESYEKIHHQAKVQLEGRRLERPYREFIAVEKDRGFMLLPEPNEGDIFFDIEGKSGIGGDGLEYLFGWVAFRSGMPEYEHMWALDEKSERKMFEKFIDFLLAHWEQYPDFHIYHFAPYEPSALKRLMTKHATREDEVDRLLRGQKFVDLFSVTRQAIRASVESYSIKQLEQFYNFQRQMQLDSASKSLREVERLIELDCVDNITSEHKKIVQVYNQDDCVSTYYLRGWLEQLRTELVETQVELPRRTDEESAPKDEKKNWSEQVREVFNQLTADIEDKPEGECQESRWLLAHMLDYFRREENVKWWEFFRLCKLSHEDLLLENRAIAGLEFVEVESARQANRTPVHRYRYPAQETVVKVGDELRDTEERTFGTVVRMDESELTIDIKKTKVSENEHPSSAFEFKTFGAGEMPAALLEFGRQVAASASDNSSLLNARTDILAGRLPRFRSVRLPYQGIDTLDTAERLAEDLDNSYLAIQGPPGAGKTHVGSHLIFKLASQGKKVGVTAVGHQVILNLLQGVLSRKNETGKHVRLVHQFKKGLQVPDGIEVSTNRESSLNALNQGAVVGGTAWLWSHPDSRQVLDYLFIDEAGQMSLAMVLAAGQAAKNIVLLGDPQQLDQPQQANHPHGSGRAALTHILRGDETIPDDRGIFLLQTWRLAPDICRFTSEQYYNSRLETSENCRCQEIIGSSVYVGSGLQLQIVQHEGNLNRSPEEVAAIVTIFAQLLDGQHQWANVRDGVQSLQPLSLDDILVVCPFNAQVHALREALPVGARIGTVDKFQGQEAPIVIYSMTSSSAVDAPRGLEFLYSRNRLNVATSRAKCLVILVCAPAILTPECSNPEQIRLANGLCRFRECAKGIL